MSRTKNQKEEKQKKIIITVLLLIMVIIINFGVVFAYFTSVKKESGKVKIGNLELQGSIIVKHNEVEVVPDQITSFLPGDTIAIEIDVTNIGKNSAWLRTVLSFEEADTSLLSYIDVYEGYHTRADLHTQLPSTSLEIIDEIAATPTVVIDGSEDQESGETYTYLESNSYSATFTIYFSPLATNDEQSKNFDFSVAVQALQFRNNDFAEPTETAWNNAFAI